MYLLLPINNFQANKFDKVFSSEFEEVELKVLCVFPIFIFILQPAIAF